MTTKDTSAARPLTREGLFAYFDQMSNEDGIVVTTADWLADMAMLIIHEAGKDGARGDAGQASRWIPVSERLPELFGIYLASVQDPDEVVVIPVWFDRVYMKFTTADKYRADPGNVIAWMPLPQAYQQEEAKP